MITVTHPCSAITSRWARIGRIDWSARKSISIISASGFMPFVDASQLSNHYSQSIPTYCLVVASRSANEVTFCR
jgi:hypothetical protein